MGRERGPGRVHAATWQAFWQTAVEGPIAWRRRGGARAIRRGRLHGTQPGPGPTEAAHRAVREEYLPIHTRPIMKTQKDACNPELLRGLADDLLPPAELTGLEQHLEWCAECRKTLDQHGRQRQLPDGGPPLSSGRFDRPHDEPSRRAMNPSTSWRPPTGRTRWAGWELTRSRGCSDAGEWRGLQGVRPGLE